MSASIDKFGATDPSVTNRKSLLIGIITYSTDAARVKRRRHNLDVYVGCSARVKTGVTRISTQCLNAGPLHS